MANPWDNDPIVSPAGGNPWENDPIVESEGGPESLSRSDPTAKARSHIKGWMALNAMPGPAGLALAPLPFAQRRAGSAAAGYADALTFSWDDEIVGLVGGKKAKDIIRADKKFAQETDPDHYMMGQAAGSVASPANRLLAPIKALKASPSIVRAGLESAKAGAKGGFLYGAGEAEDGEKLWGGAQGAVIGGLVGAPLGAAGRGVANKIQTGQIAPKDASTIILNAAVEDMGVPNSSVGALRQILRSSGYSRNDIDRGLVNVFDRLQTSSKTGDRTGLFALELQKEFKAAGQNIQDVFQQLATAPPKQGQTARIMQTALDDQYSSQRTHFDRVAQERLGSKTVSAEQDAIAAQRAEIGQTRDRVINYATTDARGRGVQNQMRSWWDEMSNDPEVAGSMRAAARQLGYKRTKAADEITQALNENPARLLQKFGEIAGDDIRANRASPVLRQARNESEALFDELSRYGRQSENVAFAPKVEGPTGPYKQQQSRFRENYSQEEAIADARGRFQAARDPVKADEFVDWYNALPEGEQSLVKTVIRQDMEKMLRGGNIDADGAYLTNLKKEGIHDVLKRVLGKDGEDISRAIAQLADEQKGLTALDPSKGLQERVVRGAAADRARNLYTTNPIARLGDRIPAMSQMADVGLIASGQLPYLTLAKQGSKVFRPRPGTREGLAKLLTMREAGNIPPPSGKPVTRMDGTPAAAAALPRMTAPDTPNTSPAVQSADTRRLAAVQKAEQAKQRALAARQAQASEGEIRALEVEAAKAEAEAVLAERQAANARKVTQEKIRQIAQTAKTKAKAASRTGRAEVERERALGERQRAQTQRFAEEDAGRMEAEAFGARTRAMEHEAAGKATAERMMQEQALESAKQMQRAGVDPRQIYQETGIISITVGDRSILVRNPKQDYTKFVRNLQRDLRRGDDIGGVSGQVVERIGYGPLQEASFAGTVPGMVTKGQRQARNALAVGSGLGALALAGGAAYSKYDENRQQRRANAYRALEGDRDATKQIQNALKRAGYYDGRRDGRFDEEVINALIRFQKNNGHRNPGELDGKTLKALAQTLEDAGETEAAEALKQLKP